MANESTSSKPRATRLYTLDVTLEESNPPIWRRVTATDAMTLADLHDVIQNAMGWEECHLHEFIFGKRRFEARPPLGDPDFEVEGEDEEQVLLGDLLKRKGQRFLYVYDFGDDWMHTVRVESVDKDPAEDFVPECLDGARACPPEDSGGMWGYTEKLAILQDPDHEYFYDIREWMGAKFDPEAFDRDRVNQKLRQAFKR